MERITGRTNPLCAHLRGLGTSASYRRSHGETVCDSPKLVKELLCWKSGLLRTLVVSEGSALPEGIPEDVRCVAVPPDLMATLSPAKTPQGMLAVCAVETPMLPEKLEGRHYVLLDGVQDPGNVGTILRTANAFGADGVFLTEGCADAWSPKTLRASMGAVFRMPVWRGEAGTFAAALADAKLPLYGAALRADTLDVRQVDWTSCAVAIGSEGRGLCDAVLQMCTHTVRIPMDEQCESLNASVAASVLLWEMARGEAFSTPGK